MNAETDDQLLTRVRTGDRDAFESLVRRHLKAAYRMALSHTGDRAEADRVCRDAFLAALRRIEACPDPNRFRPWLLDIVRRRVGEIRGSGE